MSWFWVEHWPWWFGGPLLGVLAAGVWKIERRFLAVSGSLGRVLDGDDESRKELRRIAEQSPDALDDALMMATLEAFSEGEIEEAVTQAGMAVPEALVPVSGPPAPRSAHLLLLVGIAAGGILSAWVSGTWAPALTLGAAHAALLGSGPPVLVVLFVGGILVGLGTRTAGGCTSGHGLNGCARLLPGSLVATASFFGTAIAVSFLLEVLAP